MSLRVITKVRNYDVITNFRNYVTTLMAGSWSKGVTRKKNNNVVYDVHEVYER
jgi:hypothetical protein